ncbi:MAG TPA: radical SAM family heme chaperone HemW [Candidatus Megaira endosymbiont of Nemacystus decipiens]|nr:radical SAM family heme chaperone HemW [Candidatus Megaera endosymbiont of Nemacystus decipiens]
MSMKPIAIYIHWPFCLSLCPYCDFNSHLLEKADIDLWIRSYKKEIAFFQEQISGRKISSIFFGGGTPSLMNPKIPQAIIEELSKYGQIAKNTEITLEANPTSYETNKFRLFKKAGINRVSIGVQSTQDKNLKFLGRKHSSSQAIEAIQSAANIFDKYSYDLIYALPGQSISDWQLELQNAQKFCGDHISLYQLTIEKGTPFYKQHNLGAFTLPSDDLAANMYEWTNSYLKKGNYNQYEISNYSKPNAECVHNLSYWNYDEYIGIGPGAHSRIHGINSIEAAMALNSPNLWLESIKTKGNGMQYQRKLSTEETVRECVMMSTRLTKGLKERNLIAKTNKNFKQVFNPEILQLYQKHNFLQIKQNTLQLTAKGLMLHNYIIPRLIKNIF